MISIGLDIDDVVKDFQSHFLQHFEFEDQSPPTSWDDPRFRTNFHLIESDVEFWKGVPDIFNPELMRFIPKCYITARSIEQWVTEYSLFTASNFPQSKVITVGMNNSKVNAVREEEVDLILDDAVHNFEDLNDNGINCLLVTRSHNESYPEPHVVAGGKRVDSLLDFQELFFTYGHDAGRYGGTFNDFLYSSIFTRTPKT